MNFVYRFDPALLNTHMLLLEQIPPRTRVLEIGAASGYLGEYLVKEKKCTVWGVEPVAAQYEEAKASGYEKLFSMTAEQFLDSGVAKGETFDAILLGDVLEHMVEPQQMLRALRTFLKPGGIVVISLPNVAHYTIRWKLLMGKWEMQESGILDRTHLRFFTRKTMRALIEGAGYQILSDRPSAGYIERFGLNKLFGIGRKALFLWPELLAPQFIFVARPKSSV